MGRQGTRFVTARRRGFFGALLSLAVLAAGPLAAAPITTSTALPVAKGEVILRWQAGYMRTDRDPSGAGRTMVEWSLPLVVAYGADADTALIISQPLFRRTLAAPAGTRAAEGLGDPRLLVRRTVSKRDRRGSTRRLALLGGFSAPAGRRGLADGAGPLPTAVQLGAGAWAWTAGAVATWQTKSWQVDVSATRTAPLPRGQTRAGAATHLDLSYQRRLAPRRLGPGVPTFTYGVLEANLVWRERRRAGGSSLPGTGGFTLWLGPGLQRVAMGWIAEAAVQVALASDSGNAPTPGWRAFVGLRIAV
ncbi:transporter [bacterium]|nr:transporter [bacterium]